MKVIKNINNNVSICVDDNNREVIAFGKGIGFKKPPYELELSQIDRTFYDLDEHYISLLNELSEDLMSVTLEIVDKANSYLKVELSKVFYFTLADHLNFAIQRAKKGMAINNPMVNEIRHLYEKELRLGEWAVKLIKKRLGVVLPRSEAGNIAMHFIDAEVAVSTSMEDQTEQFVEDITDIVNDTLNIIIDRNDFTYSRFVTHLKYLLKRVSNLDEAKSENVKMYEKVRAEYPYLLKTTEKIKEYMTACLGIEPSEEELLYLMLHLNRLCAREGL